jgi:hypothetical protein
MASNGWPFTANWLLAEQLEGDKTFPHESNDSSRTEQQHFTEGPLHPRAPLG